MMGFEAHAMALEEFWCLFECYEAECRRMIESCVRHGNFKYFGEWCDSKAEAMKSGTEELFYSASDIDELREKWLEEHKDKVFGLEG